MSWETLFQTWVPLVVALDPIGMLPVVAGFTAAMTPARRRRTIRRSLGIALGVSVGFMTIGRALLRWLGITIADFLVAGGGILFCLAVRDLWNHRETAPVSGGIEVVPLGTPLLAGPALLATALLLTDRYGLGVTLVGMGAAFGVTAVVFFGAEGLIRRIGLSGARAVSKVMSLILAAYAVMIIRRGVQAMFSLQ